MEPSTTKRECDDVERELGELLDRGTPEEVADFAASRLAWAIEKIRALSALHRTAA